MGEGDVGRCEGLILVVTGGQARVGRWLQGQSVDRLPGARGGLFT